MSFTDQKPRIATEEKCKASWCGGKNGKYFHCYLCGHKFKPGDYWRWIYTNSTPGASGNPMVCKKCDTPDAVEVWKSRIRDVKVGTHRSAARLFGEER